MATAALSLAAPASLAVAATAGPAGGIAGTGKFGLSPAPDSQGRVAPYFSLTIPAGRSSVATIVVSNLGARTEKL
jgi:hypothetical protein